MLASIAIIVGIIFAYIQINQANDLEKRRTAVEAIRQTRSNEFLKAYARLKKESLKTKQIVIFPNKGNYTIDDVNYVINIYDYIAILYISNIADRCLIKDAVYEAGKDSSGIFDQILIDGNPYPKEYRKNLDTFLLLMEKESCE